jgi:AcrR family transcriptional regulator
VDLLAENNSSSLEIPNLCKRLGVTKGSFYWHFAGRSELLSAILEDWRRRMTLDVTRRVPRVGPTVEAALRYVLGLIRKPRSNRSGAMERSVRDWARTDPLARAAVIDVDQIRLMFFEQLFRQRNFPRKEARVRAYAAYAMMMGDSILKETVDPSYPPEDYVNIFIDLLIGEDKQLEADKVMVEEQS